MSRNSENEAMEEDKVEEASPPAPAHILGSETICLAYGVVAVVNLHKAAAAAQQTDDYDWWIDEVQVRVTFERKDEVYLAAGTNLTDLRLEMKHVTVFVGKVKGKSEVVVRIQGLNPLSQMHENSTLRVYLNASLNGKLHLSPKEFYAAKDDGTVAFVYTKTQPVAFSLPETGFSLSPGRSEITGKFWIEAYWEHYPLQNSQSYLSRVATEMLSQEIQELEGVVQLKANNGNTVKFYKGMLAASSDKYRAQFGSGMRESSASAVVLEVRCHPDKILSERALRAFVQFVATFTIEEPLKSSIVALQLLMAGQYNLIPEMVSSMRSILLGKPIDWYDVETSITMYSYANEMYKSLEDNNTATAGEKSAWGRLIIRALWTLRGKTKQELLEVPGIHNIFPNEASIELFATTLVFI